MLAHLKHACFTEMPSLFYPEYKHGYPDTCVFGLKLVQHFCFV